MNLLVRLLTVSEVAHILGVDEQTIKRYENEGILKRVNNIKVIRCSPDMLAQVIGLERLLMIGISTEKPRHKKTQNICVMGNMKDLLR